MRRFVYKYPAEPMAFFDLGPTGLVRREYYSEWAEAMFELDGIQLADGVLTPDAGKRFLIALPVALQNSSMTVVTAEMPDFWPITGHEKTQGERR